jgi:uncharacterized membrane protein YhhN
MKGGSHAFGANVRDRRNSRCARLQSTVLPALALAFVVAYVISGTLAIVGAERDSRGLQLVFKPLTTLLLLGVVGFPETTFARLVAAGVVLSVVGDIALLGQGNGAFIGGLVAFLLAHVAYIAAFAGFAVWSVHVVVVAAAVAITTGLVLRAIWAGAVGLHGPTIAYGVVISAMVASAAATVGGRLTGAPLVAVGAVLFYASDASLALNRFRQPFPHSSIFTMGVYWLGQLGIAVVARWAS